MSEAAYPTVTAPSESQKPKKKRRWWLRILVVASLLLALVYLGGGWFFSGLVYNDALFYKAYDPATVQTGVLKSVDVEAGTKKGEVQYARGDEFAEMSKFEKTMVGLKAPSGLLVVGPATKVENGVETRPVIDVVGTAPEAGADVGLVRDVWTTPAEAGLASTDVNVPGENGAVFPAWQILAPKQSTTWAVLAHGKGASRSEQLRLARILHAKDINCLVISYSNDAGAPANEDGMVHFGKSEWKDMESAVKYVQGQGAQKLILGGISHGGAVTMGFLKHSSLAPAVNAIILDAPASSLRDVIDEAANFHKMPAINTDIPESLQKVAIWITAMRYDLDYDAVDYTDMDGLVKIPVLLFQGTDDRTVPEPVNDRFAEKQGDKVQLEVVKGAEHVLTWNVDPFAFQSKVNDFLAKNGLAAA